MTTDRDDIASLLAKVTAATGPSHELDRLITEITEYPNVYRNEDGSIPFTAIVANFTGSVDAALALLDRLLGVDATALCYSYDFGWHASAHAEMAYTANLHLAIGNPAELHTAHGQATTLPLAILAALLKSLTSLKENHP